MKNKLDVFDKYTHEKLAGFPYADEVEIEKILSLSVAGFEALKTWSGEQRKACLYKIADLLEVESEIFAKLISQETGKNIVYCRGEVSRSLVTLRLSAEEATRIGGEVVPVDYGAGKGKTAFTKRFPVGPVFGIVPFNFPINLAMHKLGPALACGCSIILKPSPYTPTSLVKFAKLLEKVDLPEGAVQVVICDNERAEQILVDERIKMLSFTGSPQVGWALKNKAGKKKVQLELGGDAAAIIDESADLDRAVKQLIPGAFGYNGQVCISTQRIYLQEKIKEKFLALFLEKIKEIPVGSPLENQNMIGPIIDKVHFDRIGNWVNEAVSQGATLLIGGEALNQEHHIYGPTVLENVPKGVKLGCEEIFGPVVVIDTFSDFNEALTKVNDSRFGLHAALFTNQIDRMNEAFEKLEVGGLLINNAPAFRVDSMPYGGIKDSGLGREGPRYSIEEMTETKLLIY